MTYWVSRGNQGLFDSERAAAWTKEVTSLYSDIIAYTESSILPSATRAAKRIIAQAENFIIVDGLLFKLDLK